MGTQNGHNVPSLESVPFKEREGRKAMTRIKQIAKIFKNGNRNIYERKKNCASWSLSSTL